jgi:hypothetical protein
MAPLLMLAGLGLALAARKRGEVGRVATTALWWNTFLLLLLVAFGLFTVWAIQSQVSGGWTEPEEVFEAVIASPIPDGVSDLQAVSSSSMQGYVAYVRFRAPSLESVGLTSPPYEPVECQRFRFALMIPDFIDSPFSPEWAPFDEGARTCLEAGSVPNRWAAGGARNQVVLAGGFIHFVSSRD